MPLVKDTVTNRDGEAVTIYIEVDTPPQTTSPYYNDLRGEGNAVIDAASDVFGKGMTLIRTCAEQVVSAVQKVDNYQT